MTMFRGQGILLLFTYTSFLYSSINRLFSPSLFILLFLHPPLILLTEHGRKYIASIFICVSERHPVSLLLGNTGVSSCSFRLGDHSCTRGSRLLELPAGYHIAQNSLTIALHLWGETAEKRNQSQ